MTRLWKNVVLCIALLALLAGFVSLAEAQNAAPVITLQPTDITIPCNSYMSFTVEATGEGLSYQWYRREPGSSGWIVYQGMTSNTLYAYALAEMDGCQFRCVVSNANGMTTSQAAAVTLSPRIWSGSGSIEGKVGDEKKIFVQAYGKDLSYQWYYRKNYGDDWTPWEGRTQSSFPITLSQEYDGWYFNCIVTAGNGLSTSAIEAFSSMYYSPKITIKEPEVILPASEVSLYYLPMDYEQYISIPSSYATSYDLTDHTLIILSGETAEIRDNTVVPKATTMYYHQLESGYWIGSTAPSGQAGERVVIEYESGDTVVQVDGSRNITFHVKSYADVYAENVMDDYMRKNIQSTMTEYAKAEKCCQFVAGFDYGTESQSYTGMVVTGSGDCWASTNTLLYMLKRLGINADSHYAGYVDGAGSGHYNVVAKLDGLYYILEAGYAQPAPRNYTMNAYGSCYAYTKTSSSTISITAFMNIDNATEIDVPAYIDGYTVTEIAMGAFQTHRELTSVSIPDTVTSIGSRAFYQAEGLQEINIPKNVTSIGVNCFCYCSSLTSVTIPAATNTIGVGAFAYCRSLVSINVEAGNASFKSLDGVLLSADGTQLIVFPIGKKGHYTVPSGVTKICEWSFVDAELDSLTLPNTLREIEPYAFYFFDTDSLTVPNGITSIPTYAFRSCGITVLTLPDTLKRIEDGAFFRADIYSAVLPSQLEYIGAQAFAGDLFLRRIHIPASVQEIGAGAFNLNHGWSSLGGPDSSFHSLDGYVSFEKGFHGTIADGAFSDAVLGVYEGTTAHTYAVNSGTPYLLLNENGKPQLDASWFKAITSRYLYTGEPLEPEVSADNTVMPVKLDENTDYRVTYEDNTEPGIGKVIITGAGGFTGTVTLTFEINANPHYIYLNPCGGSVSGSYYYIYTAYGSPYGELPNATKYNCTFDGWYTKKTGGTRVTKDTICTTNEPESLYAHWIVGDMNYDGRIDALDTATVWLFYNPTRIYHLPAATTAIQSQAFADVPAEVIYIPASVTSIADDAFPEDVILILENSRLSEWADKNGYDYIIEE